MILIPSLLSAMFVDSLEREGRLSALNKFFKHGDD